MCRGVDVAFTRDHALASRFPHAPAARGETSASLKSYVEDRKGHDRRYALSSEKLTRETGWAPAIEFEPGLARTLTWYQANAAWVARVRSGEYRSYSERTYGNRSGQGLSTS